MQQKLPECIGVTYWCRAKEQQASCLPDEHEGGLGVADGGQKARDVEGGLPYGDQIQADQLGLALVWHHLQGSCADMKFIFHRVTLWLDGQYAVELLEY